MVKLKNIHPLSDFVRNAKTHLGKLKKSGEPAVLTVNGEAEAVVLSAEAYEKMMEEYETLENLNAIHKGMVQAQRGEGIPAGELIRRLKEGPKRRKSA
jgi:prevent-host-death family protein